MNPILVHLHQGLVTGQAPLPCPRAATGVLCTLGTHQPPRAANRGGRPSDQGGLRAAAPVGRRIASMVWTQTMCHAPRAYKARRVYTIIKPDGRPRVTLLTNRAGAIAAYGT